jgi:NAD-dependent dihydropyrimidine dehydrogenase PreA subunit
MEMATMWGGPLLFIGGPVVTWLWGWSALVACAATVVTIVGGIFALLPWLRVTGGMRWLTFAAFAALGMAAGTGLLLAFGSPDAHIAIVGVTAAIATGILAIDLAGTTPWYGSYINTFHEDFEIDLVEERCTGAADCVLVCPRDVLKMNGARRKVEITHPEQCIRCGACVVQCPEDALQFRYDDGRVVEAKTIRRTRMNMVGRRTVHIRD